MDTVKEFDYLVIGGGSGGMASAICAREFNASVGVIEGKCLGGICINVGCIPQKLMYHCSNHTEFIRDMPDYGFDITYQGFNFAKFKESCHSYVRQLNESCEMELKNSKIEIINGFGAFVDDNGTVIVEGKMYKGKNTLIAVGGKPKLPEGIAGGEYGISSDQFFQLQNLPKKSVVVGAGPIALEIAGVLSAFGSETHMLIRHEHVLRHFDHSIIEAATEALEKGPIRLHKNTNVEKVEKNSDGTLKITTKEGLIIDNIECLIWAIGRSPSTKSLNLHKIGIKTDSNGYIIVDENQQTSVPGIFALGDVCGETLSLSHLRGRILAHRLFNPNSNLNKCFLHAATVISSHPPVGSLGLTGAEAVKKYGKDQIKIYKCKFVPLYFAITEYKESCIVKLVCFGKEEKIVGIHLIGRGVDEMLQGFAVALQMGVTKKELDFSVPIHPTSSEEIVLMRNGVKPGEK